MGSLMAGWDSPRSPKGELQRKSSMTKDEVEKFWKARRLSPEALTGEVMQTEVTLTRPAHLAKSLTIPGTTVAKTSAETELSPGSGDWWTRSSWAFLNDPPNEIRPGEASRYAPQFDVASRASLSREMSSSFNCNSSPILGSSF